MAKSRIVTPDYKCTVSRPEEKKVRKKNIGWVDNKNLPDSVVDPNPK
jgi:hypothetical protein